MAYKHHHHASNRFGGPHGPTAGFMQEEVLGQHPAQVGDDQRGEVKLDERLAAVDQLNVAPKEVQREHVEQQVEEIAVQEAGGHQLPQMPVLKNVAMQGEVLEQRRNTVAMLQQQV